MPPASNSGIAGDYYIDTATHVIYGPASHHCLPLPCATQWGEGHVPNRPNRRGGRGGGRGDRLPNPTMKAKCPTASPADIATLPLVTAGYYTITATVDAEHSGNDTTTWSCSLLGAERGG